MNDPKCLNCNSFLDYDELVDESFAEPSLYIAVQSGICPECGKKYRWNEVYVFDHIENFEEMEGE